MKWVHAILICAIATMVTSTALARTDNQEKADKAPPPETPAAEPFITRVYNVRDLIAPELDFPLATSKYKNAFVSPGGDAEPSPYGNITGSTSGSGQPIPTTGPASNAAAAEIEATDNLIRLVEDFVDRDTWRDNGGAAGALKVVNGCLVISQTRANHEQIATLLNALQHEQSKMVRVAADWVLLSTADFAKLAAPKAGDTAVTPVDPAFLKSLPANAGHFSAQTVSRNGQTVHILSGSERSLITGYMPVVTTGSVAYSTELSHIGSGLALEVNARADIDQKSALVTISSSFSDPVQITKQSVPVAPPVTQPGSTVTTIDTYRRNVQDLRTTIRIPLNTPVIAGSMSLEPASKGADEQVLTLILTVTASQ